MDAIAKLKAAGYIVTIATNQSIISKQLASIDDLNAIHAYLQKLLMQQYKVQIDDIFFCPHKEEENCNCRKPNPGMLLNIAERYKVKFSEARVPFVGDSIIDVLAAVKVGAVPVLVRTGKGANTVLDPQITQINNLLIFNDLNEFVDYWLQK